MVHLILRISYHLITVTSFALITYITPSTFNSILSSVFLFLPDWLHGSWTCTELNGHLRSFCFSFLVFYILFLPTCTTLNSSHSAFWVHVKLLYIVSHGKRECGTMWVSVRLQVTGAIRPCICLFCVDLWSQRCFINTFSRRVYYGVIVKTNGGGHAYSCVRWVKYWTTNVLELAAPRLLVDDGLHGNNCSWLTTVLVARGSVLPAAAAERETMTMLWRKINNFTPSEWVRDSLVAVSAWHTRSRSDRRPV